MPPRGGTPWASSRGALLSDRIRPSVSQPAKSEKGQGRGKGKGRANVAAAEPPRSAAVRMLDEFIEGLLSSESAPLPSRSQSKTQNKSATEDSDACFCQGKRSFLSLFFPLALASRHTTNDYHHPSHLSHYFRCTPTLPPTQPACTHYRNTRPFALAAASSSARTITRTAPVRTAPRRSSLRPRVARSSRSSRNCARRR